MGKIVDGIFYDSEGKPTHAGIVNVDGKLYYAGKDGKIIKDDKKTVHHGMANGLVKHGKYYFDKNGVIRLRSFSKPASSKKKTAQEKKALYKKISIIAVCLIAAAILLFIAVDYFRSSKEPSESAPTESAISTEYKITLPEWDEEVWLCTDAMKKYYQGEISLLQAVQSKAGAYAPLQFKYRMQNAASAQLLLSENEDYSDSAKYELDVTADQLTIDNLKTATTYYFLVVAKDKNGKTHADGGEFTTADTNRLISLPGMYNVRDIGGYQTADGSRVKQGLLYRGSELDGLVNGKYFLTDLDAIAPLGIAYDFDLRSSNIINLSYVSRLSVPHKFYAAPAYSDIFRTAGEASLREIFRDLADKSHYPMYLHGTNGADRTGTIVFLLQGILGVSEEDMSREYALSCFLNENYAGRTQLQAVYAGLQSMQGETLNEKITAFLTDIVGVPPEQIRHIRSIFLETE